MTPLDLVRAYWEWLAALGLVLAAWVVHVMRVERLVRMRTAELAAVNTDLRREIARRREVEERESLHRKELDHAARLSVLGEMASGLAHELNQPLAAITNYADGCEMRLRSGQTDANALMEATARIRQQAARAAQVIQRMRAFARKREPLRAPIDAADVMRECLDLFEGVVRRAGVSVTTSMTHDAPRVMADRIQLQQVLLNVLQNAVDAMQAVPSGQRRLHVDVTSSTDGVSMCVTDNGGGMSAETKARLFEPFFTTKPDGLGLGLALCHSLVEAHGGRLTAADAPGGTTMTLWLPVADNALGEGDD